MILYEVKIYFGSNVAKVRGHFNVSIADHCFYLYRSLALICDFTSVVLKDIKAIILFLILSLI